MSAVPEPLTVVILNDFSHVNGGASRIAIDEAVSLASVGVEVIYVGAVAPVSPELREADLRLVHLDQSELVSVGKKPWVALQGLWNAPAARALGELLATLDPRRTIVHAHSFTKALSSSPLREARRRGFEVVVTLHDYFVVCPNGGFFDYQTNAPCGRRALSTDCVTTNCDKRHYVHKLYRIARGAAQRSAFTGTHGVRNYISLSAHSEALIRAYLPADARFFPLENLIEARDEGPADVADNRAVVAVGRLDPEKGVELLLDACQRASIQLTLVGDGPLRAQAEQSPNVRVTGWLAPAEVARELRAARCLVFASTWYETYGLVVSEAAAAGVPAIVSDVTAAAERVRDGIDGWVFRSGDVGSLVHALERTRNADAVRAAGLAAYRRFWEQPPTRQNHVRGLLEIYASVLAGGALASASVGAEQRDHGARVAP